MQIFTIRDIENLTGIKAHTLRVWEQRYEGFTSKRKGSQHRYYDNEDLKKMLRIAFLYHQGLKISKIASLTEPGIIATIQNTPYASGNYAHYVSRLMEAAIDFNEVEFTLILRRIKEQIGFEKCVTEVCYPYLKRLGVLWSTNNIIPAQEHFSSYLIQKMIIAETEKISSGTESPVVLLCCPQGEFHELPLLFINYMLRKNNWSTLYLGANIKLNEIIHISSIKNIPFLYMHLLTNFTGMDPEHYFEQLCRNLPEKKIIASGVVIQNMENKAVNLTLLKSDQQMYNFIQHAAKNVAEHRS